MKEGLETESEIETGVGKVDGVGSARRVKERQIKQNKSRIPTEAGVTESVT